MSTDPKNGLEAHEQAARAIYDRNAAQPLTTEPGQLHASFAVQQAQKYSGEVYEKTGKHLDVNSYRFLDDYNAALAEPIISSDISRILAATRVSDDPEGDRIALDKRIAADTEESRRRIIAQYGPKDGPELIERTQRWVRTKPALARLLQPRGLGSKPEIVEQLVAFVFSNGIR